MISLPQLEIVRDEMAEVQLYLKVKTWLQDEDKHRPEGIHATDLLDPLYAYWQKTQPKDLAERQVWFFAIGKVLHMLVLAAFNPADAEYRSDAGTAQAFEIYYSPDGHTQDGKPIELKTHRGLRAPPPERVQSDFQHYLEQLAIYLVMENRLEGELWVLFISLQDASGRTFPEPRCFKVTLTMEQFYDIEKQIFETRDRLATALAELDPSKLDLCRSWKCGRNCAYFDVCRPVGRFPSTDHRTWKA